MFTVHMAARQLVHLPCILCMSALCMSALCMSALWAVAAPQLDDCPCSTHAWLTPSQSVVWINES